MLLHHSLSNKLTSFRLSLIDNNLMVFAKLYLVVFKSLSQTFVLRGLFQVVKELQAAHRHWENLSGCLKDLLILLVEHFEFFVGTGGAFATTFDQRDDLGGIFMGMVMGLENSFALRFEVTGF